MDSFTVLIAVHLKDDASHFYKSLESVVINQTLLPEELILIKDGPLDDSKEEVIREISKRTNINVKIISNKRSMGLAFSLNKGIKHCNSNWIARMDSDDISHRKRFEVQMAYIQNNPDISVLGSGFILFNSKEKERIVIYPEKDIDIKKKLKYKNVLAHSSTMIKVDALPDSGYPQLHRAQDHGLWVILASKGKKFGNVPRPLLFHRISENPFQQRGLIYLSSDIKILKIQLRSKQISFSLFCIVFIYKLSRRVISQLVSYPYSIFFMKK